MVFHEKGGQVRGFGRELLEPVISAHPRATVTHIADLPPREGRAVDWPSWVPSHLVAALDDRGIARPWTHQAITADHAWAGRHCVVATGTASGKSSVICCRCSPGSWRIPPRRHCIFRRPRPWAPISSPPHANSPSMRCVGDVAAGRRQAMNPATCTPCRSRPTTGTRPRTCGGRCAKVRGGSSPTRTCCTSACSPGTSGGRGCCGSWSTSSSTSATPTAGYSAPTSRWSCGACCAWPATTARTRRWCSPPRRRPIRRRRPRG